MRKYQRLRNEQRQKLSFLLLEGRNQRQIGESLNVRLINNLVKNLNKIAKKESTSPVLL
jgi:hypothetical protein